MFKVGDEVVIRKSSEFYDVDAEYNPADTKGTVVGVLEDGLPIKVVWSTGCENTYEFSDLEHYKQDTQETKQYTSGIPEVGMEVGVEYNVGGESYREYGVVLYASNKSCILSLGGGEVYFDMEDYDSKYIPLPTEDEKVTKGLHNILTRNLDVFDEEDERIIENTVKQILAEFDIKLKGGNVE